MGATVFLFSDKQTSDGVQDGQYHYPDIGENRHVHIGHAKRPQPAAIAPAPMPETAKGGMSKLKNWVKTAVNCCIE
ncbi:hypothetical protein HDR63_02465 [bacterium]|nr:hypothetical protein [bacterium]